MNQPWTTLGQRLIDASYDLQWALIPPTPPPEECCPRDASEEERRRHLDAFDEEWERHWRRPVIVAIHSLALEVRAAGLDLQAAARPVPDPYEILTRIAAKFRREAAEDRAAGMVLDRDDD